MQTNKSCQACPLLKVAANTCGEVELHDKGAQTPCGETTTIEKGQTFSNDMCTGGDLIAVCSGALALRHTLGDGRSSLTELFMHGDLVVRNRIPKEVQIVALRPTTICCRPMENLFFASSQEKGLTSIVVERLGQQSRLLSLHCADVAMKTPPERLAAFLCEYSDRNLENGANANNLQIQMCRSDIANYIALEPETVSRSFTKLAHSGVIEMSGRYNMKIVNKAKLDWIANGGLPRQSRSASM